MLSHWESSFLFLFLFLFFGSRSKLLEYKSILDLDVSSSSVSLLFSSSRNIGFKVTVSFSILYAVMEPIVCHGSSAPIVIMTIDLQKGAWATIIAQPDLVFDQAGPMLPLPQHPRRMFCNRT